MSFLYTKIKTMYKIVQNFNTSEYYDYTPKYSSISEAEAVVSEYIADDKQEAVYNDYTIVDKDYNDIEALETEEFESQALAIMQDMGLPKDEAELLLSDYNAGL